MKPMKTVTYEKQARVAIIKFNRPEALNAYNLDVMKDLIAAFELARQDKEVGVVVWKGEGRAWNAGADIKFISRMKDVAEAQDFHALEEDSTRIIMNLGKPIVAAIQGYAVGGGCEYAMLADIRIAAEGTRFGFPETTMGGVITHAGTKILPQLVGLAKAKELIMIGEMIEAKEAERLGLVNKVVAPEELDEVAMSVAEKIASSPPLAVNLMKYALDHGVDWDYETSINYESKAGLFCMACGDIAKGYGAWADKKKR